MEFEVNPDTGPFLVSSSQSFVWITPTTNKVRAAVRSLKGLTVDDIFRALVLEVAATGSANAWGNVHPLTSDGVRAAEAHLTEYELTDIVCCAHPNTETTLFAMPVTSAPWVPEGYAVLLPKELDFVGMLVMTPEHFLVVAHNTSRAVAVLR